MKKATSALHLGQASVQERRAVLAAWVARLNSAVDERYRDRLDRWLTQALDEFDREQMSSIDEDELRRRFEAWLETAGETGGPEQSQDPTQAHPAAWHGNRSESKR
jgi:hypothetical protein